MNRYIVMTKSVWIDTNLVEAKNKKEAFQKVVAGDTIHGQGEGDVPELISTKQVENGEEYFAYLDFEKIVEDDYDTIDAKFQSLPTIA